MKKLVQNTGVRKWYGDEWITIQDEANAVIEGFLGHYGTPFILSGCGVDGTTIAPGIVGLIHADGFKLCRFAGTTGLTFPIYLKPIKTEHTGQYLDGATKPIAYTYAAETSDITGSGYLEIKADDSAPRFNDIIQDASHRMVSDVEKANYAGQAASAITAIRGGVAETYNTLEKLSAALPDSANLQLLAAALLSYIDGLSYFPVYRGRSALVGNIINWLNSTPEVYKTIDTPTELNAENLVEGKTIGALISGDAELTFSDKFKQAFGSPNYSRTSLNYIQMKCLNATPGSEFILYSITLIAL
jgi:hypothetical protein